MLRSLSTAATGMEAQQAFIDNVSHNLANVNTAGFKKGRVHFEDLLYENISTFGNAQDGGAGRPLSSQVGHGVRIAGTQKVFSQGSSRQTENPMDMMIDGNGFFQISLPDGTVAYTRDGNFNLDADGSFVKAAGYLLEPAITVPNDTQRLEISGQGRIFAVVPNDPEPVGLARLEIVKFVNPAGLEAVGHNLFVETAASGPPIAGNPGNEGFGEISVGFLEMSNVNVVEEMVSMITAQRAYELNSKSIQTADQMLESVNNLKR